jgi:hypothetical protein
MHPGPKLGRLGQIGRPRCAIHRFGDTLSTQHRLPRPRSNRLITMPAAADVQSNPHQPCREPLRLAEVVEAEQRLQDGFLGGVFRPIVGPKRTATHGEEKRLMTREKRGKRSSIPTTRGLDQCGVLFVSIHRPGAPSSSRIVAI